MNNYYAGVFCGEYVIINLDPLPGSSDHDHFILKIFKDQFVKLKSIRGQDNRFLYCDLKEIERTTIDIVNGHITLTLLNDRNGVIYNVAYNANIFEGIAKYRKLLLRDLKLADLDALKDDSYNRDYVNVRTIPEDPYAHRTIRNNIGRTIDSKETMFVPWDNVRLKLYADKIYTDNLSTSKGIYPSIDDVVVQPKCIPDLRPKTLTISRYKQRPQDIDEAIYQLYTYYNFEKEPKMNTHLVNTLAKLASKEETAPTDVEIKFPGEVQDEIESLEKQDSIKTLEEQTLTLKQFKKDVSKSSKYIDKEIEHLEKKLNTYKLYKQSIEEAITYGNATGNFIPLYSLYIDPPYQSTLYKQSIEQFRSFMETKYPDIDTVVPSENPKPE